jgi:hypothetical protein
MNNDLWYALPLILAASLVYAATRHERTAPILMHAFRLSFSILSVLAAILVALAGLSWLRG